MATRAKVSILVVEEDQQVRKLIASILTGAGYPVCQARNSFQAARLLNNPDSVPGLVIVDTAPSAAELPSGFRLLLLSPDPARHPDTPVLTKPFKPEMLLRKVRDLVG